MSEGGLRTCLRRFPTQAALVFGVTLLSTALPSHAVAIESIPDFFPLRPFNFDVSFNQRTFAPQARVIAVQAGLTAFRYGNLEVRTVYQYYSHHTPTFITDQNSVYLNPRWNNFIDILDFPKDNPINRMIRHVLFGPLEDRAVPYLGGIIGGTIQDEMPMPQAISMEARWVCDSLWPEDFQSIWGSNTHDLKLTSRINPTCRSNGSLQPEFDSK